MYFLRVKVSVKLDRRKSGKSDKGFPIIVYVTQNYKNKVIRTGFFSKDRDWNRAIAEPRASHPDYYLVSDYLTGLKERIKALNLASARQFVSIDEARDILFRKNRTKFYDEAIAVIGPDCRASKWSALKSFDRAYPSVECSEISPKMVEKYKNALLKKGNRPGGVDSYLRSLRAIWNKTGRPDNPFAGHTVKIPVKAHVVANEGDLKLLAGAKLSYRGEIGSSGMYRDYFLLMFYLGGIDPEVLAKLRYDEHWHDGRIRFNRNKGGSTMACNNLVPLPAVEILKRYDCRPYLVPIYRSTDYGSFLRNFNRRFKKTCEKLGLSAPLRPKTPRYTFIDRAQQLLIDERVTAQIVGHKRRTVTSLYTNDFPVAVQDRAHLKIISF